MWLIGLFKRERKEDDGWTTGPTGESKGKGAERIPQPSSRSAGQSDSSITTPRVRAKRHSGSSVKSRSRTICPSPPSSPTPLSYSRRPRKQSLLNSRHRRFTPSPPPPPPPSQQQQQEAHVSFRVPCGSPLPLSRSPPLSHRPAPVKNMPPTTGTKPPRGEYIETDTGNKVARRAQLHGTQHIILGGRAVIQPQVCIRGDLVRTLPPSSSSTVDPPESDAAARAQQQQNTVAVAIGRYSFISSGSVLRPPYKLHRGKTSYHPLKIGEHVFVGPNCVIEAASIGDRVHIGAGSVLGRFAILKEGCRVLEGTVVPGGMVVPSGCVIGGRPGSVLGDVGDGYGFGELGGDLRELWRRTG